MEKLLHFENEWCNNIDANKVEGTVRRSEVERVRCTMNRTMTNTFFYICNLHFFK